MLSANLRWATHHNDSGNYIQGYRDLTLCDVGVDNATTVESADDYALVTAMVSYHKGDGCAVSSLNLTFHMIPALDQLYWRIDRVDLR